MRKKSAKNGITIKAFAGTTGILLAFNVTDAKRKGLLGFSLERRNPDTKKWEWMSGMMPFPGQAHDAGAPISTDISPIQKFRWSDYRVHHETTYSYRVHGMYGDPAQPAFVKGPMVTVTTSSSDEDGVHNVVFNRAAGASQAFLRNFPEAVKLMEDKRKNGGFSKLTVDDLEKVSPGCKDWLSRGVLSKIISVIESARDKKWALDIAIYEYEWHEIVEAVNEASKRGVNIRLLYHAKKGDKQTKENKENAGLLINAGQAKERITSSIFHDKFIVLSKVTKNAAGIKRHPVTVLCGSTNFTHNGLFRQANLVHIVRTPKGEKSNPTANEYETLFDTVWNGDGNAALTTSLTSKWITDKNPMDPQNQLFAGFSPRKGKGDLAHFIKLINAARADVLFSTAFVLPKEIVDALVGKAGDPILRLGIQNTNANKIAGFHRDKSAQFAATALANDGFEAWLKEATIAGAGNILIHTKIVVVDFTTDAPVIISGSHNLSGPASQKNDENYLVIQGNTDLADSYGVEVMRIYDHYRARWVVQEMAKKKSSITGTLQPNNKWTDRYFKKDSLHFRDRLRFIGN
ncbi:MAG: phospholipase [Chitinophagaceae bacterium]|nr:phospholipase [Chitinophagaceae bacterium]MBK8787360.1 phospholipase [Chitinophagaceae bacterium]MBK9485864.1 phospholipase [Chitinophagaceae bacterium]MBL0201302.1 phospholipase [Chitinophagaceae bacterium]